VGACLSLAFNVTATAAMKPTSDFEAARTQFEAGRAGSVEANLRAQQLFAQLLRADAENPLYLAYYGTTFTLQARDTHMPWTRINLINEGTSLLDRALAHLDQPANAARTAAKPGAGPAALETRLVAMATFIALPEALFHRHASAKREYQNAIASPEFATASADLRGHLEYEGALIARNEGDTATERATLRRVVALAPPSIDLAEVRARLAELH
jgi:hypothetical protein